MTSINRMAVGGSVATVRRRANSVVLSTPAPETNITSSIRFVEEEQISDFDGVRYADSNTSLFDQFSDRVFTLYDTANAPAAETADLTDMTLEEFLALDNKEGGLRTDLPEIGTFTYQDLADMIFSIYVALADDRENPPEPVEPEPEPETGTEETTDPAETTEEPAA